MKLRIYFFKWITQKCDGKSRTMEEYCSNEEKKNGSFQFVFHKFEFPEWFYNPLNFDLNIDARLILFYRKTNLWLDFNKT